MSHKERQERLARLIASICLSVRDGFGVAVITDDAQLLADGFLDVVDAAVDALKDGTVDAIAIRQQALERQVAAIQGYITNGHPEWIPLDGRPEWVPLHPVNDAE